ncbi:MAG TPA: carbohydrate kinase family protein [Candidatus Hydrogenedens sp.]|nr:carbohydrate kinase family protein [Candidatus Hydrogenedens sp.]HOL19716.1 carbohydrate kinase family protein [Candidatus Hydrogenedens sp.]HPP58739.1 carbohydrate kinase family protein [Candidatus Hydrogenedens sp.]
MKFDLVTVGVVCADVMVKPVDTFPNKGTLSLVPQLEIYLGGLAGVTAVVFSKLGGKSAFIGQLGEDRFGDFILQALTSSGVNVDGVKRTREHSSSATVVLINSQGERTFLHHVGTNASVSDEDLDFNVITSSRMLHWGGSSITPKLDGEPIGRIFEKARSLGVKTSIDTCYDGKGIWLPHIEPALRHTNIIFSSLEEARHYTGRQEPEDIADFYMSYGVEIAVIKMGEYGVLVKSKDERIQLPAYPVPVVDTTGAGDASCGGFLFAYLSGYPLLECAKIANAVGALTVQVMGGANGVQSLEHVLTFIKSMEKKNE